ncbi:glycosyltransferase family 2 protein [Flavobacterium poyangense]|uniref:glycosyltransferase family 2 protein n=1 Tax=Flavobacterium poyangense TaxID=2204302 RepID=UPI001420AC43|nr:glycosyltransferase family 2 protein [Flavobacterium sp. JXAS1]
MSLQDPKVSIIVPSYNQGQFINETLLSVYNQIYVNWECIIVNDGSTDNTEEIARLWQVKDSRFKYFYKENSGVSSTRNFGISKATGIYLQFLDSDDLLDEKKIQLSVDQIQKTVGRKPQVVISNFKMISSDSKEILPAFCEVNEKSFTFENFLYNLFSIQLQCGFFDIKLFENIKFPEKLSAQEDWIVWINIFKNNPNYSFIDLPLAYYRINPSGRMNTIGADDNQIKILDSLKEILTYDQYHKFSVDLISRHFNSAKLFKNNLNEVKKSNTYQFGLLIKKVLEKMRLLGLGKQIFKHVLKFKSKN